MKILSTILLSSILASGATIQTRSGDIRTFVNAVVVPTTGSQGFITPSAADITAWRTAIDALLAGKYQTAADLADPLGYDVVQFSDTVRSRTYYALVERTNSRGNPMRGLGTYVYNPSACRPLSFLAPHPGSDLNTRGEAVTLFAELNATTLLMAGTERCANAGVSTCDGSTTACGDGKFHESDVAHFTTNFFQPAHEEIVKTVPNLITVAIHGEGSDTPNVIISNGTCATYPAQSVATLLANQYNKTLKQLGTDLTAGTCDRASGITTLCAEVDVAGRYSNGSASLCNCTNPTASACSTTLGCAPKLTFPERFIHVEQDCTMRGLSTCPAPAGVDFEMAVGVFAAVFPCSPKIQSVVQGASFQPDPLAPGSFFSLFGDSLGTQEQAGATAAFSLGGIQAQFCGLPARLIYNSGAGQVNGLVPAGVAGNSSCTVSVAPSASYTIPPVPAIAKVPITAQNIAIFPYVVNSTLTVPIITNASYQLIGPPVTGFVRAKKGDAIILWTTGGGLTTPLVADQQVAPATGAIMQKQPTARIAGVNATVLYAGLGPGFIGLYQINILVPAGTPSGKVALTLASGIGDASYDLWIE